VARDRRFQFRPGAGVAVGVQGARTGRAADVAMRPVVRPKRPTAEKPRVPRSVPPRAAAGPRDRELRVDVRDAEVAVRAAATVMRRRIRRALSMRSGMAPINRRALARNSKRCRRSISPRKIAATAAMTREPGDERRNGVGARADVAAELRSKRKTIKIARRCEDG